MMDKKENIQTEKSNSEVKQEKDLSFMPAWFFHWHSL